MSAWQGRRVVVIGASAGVGRSTAVQLVGHGAEVTFCARRAEQLAEAVSEAGGGEAVVFDLAGDTHPLVAAVGDRPIDVVLVCAGIGALRPLQTTTPEQWSSILSVNLVGVNRAIAALVPHLAEGAVVAVLSSESAGDPLWGLGAYSASKAALESTLLSWKREVPGVRFSCLSIGATVPSDFGNYLDPALLGEAFQQWTRRGYSPGMMQTPNLADSLIGMLGAILEHPDVNIEYALVRAPEVASPVDLAGVAESENQLTIE